MSKRTIVQRPSEKMDFRKNQIELYPVLQTKREISLAEMKINTEKWQSEINFYYDEINFYRKLMDNYFMWFIDEKYIEDTRKLISDLTKFEKKRFSLSQRLGRLVKQVTIAGENKYISNIPDCQQEYAELEILIFEFKKEFRCVKNEIFARSENVRLSHKARYLLNGYGR
ncbi:hypothetical protein SanaruYs_05760 [Chryseotalea sanaruensis]|uniref:Uncharacterized protein n=1 Tax=Chryseotalea sanaruensis TaxID=2482724 RepID=A0A401U616_9BACT|nr:hypothetical protein [Chryseotalea sanaruensis]GCC50361.1 hypothetical protein SanaruYs_05760 [Chryseotalea sanaruensis]